MNEKKQTLKELFSEKKECLIGLINPAGRKIDSIVRKASPIYLGIAYAVVIGFWIWFDEPLIIPNTDKSFPTKLQTYQTLIVSIGAVFIAIIAYWGATATTRFQNKKEQDEKIKYETEYYPAELIFQLSNFNLALFYIIDKVDNDRFHFKNESFYYKELVDLNFELYTSKINSLFEILSIEKVKHYKSYYLIQAYKYRIIILDNDVSKLKKNTRVFKAIK